MKTKKPKYFAVTGNPVLHSRSPQLFNSAYPDHPHWHYSRLSAKNAREAIEIFEKLNLTGMNITSPFKSEILPFVNDLSPDAEKISAVNTIIRNNNSTFGYNTDINGVEKTLSMYFPAMLGQRCLILGAGNSAKASALAVMKLGGQAAFIARSVVKAVSAADKIGCEIYPSHEINKHLENADLLISTIPPSSKIFNMINLPKHITVFDAVYHNSRIESLAKENGCRYISGKEWLMHQAIPAFRLFTEEEPHTENMQNTLQFSGIRKNSIALTGMMGSGKSTAGKLLAKELGYEFTDLDKHIEKLAGRSIPDIFNNDGESRFRELEENALADLRKAKNTVIACGGGAILSAKNKSILKNFHTIWLHSSPEICYARIAKSDRPLIYKRGIEKFKSYMTIGSKNISQLRTLSFLLKIPPEL